MEWLRNLILIVLVILLVLVLCLGFSGILSPNEIITSILTVISSIILLITLIEIKNQRESMYKPDIVLKSSGRFYIYSEGKFPSLWLNEEIARAKIFSKQTNFPKYEMIKLNDQDIHHKLIEDPNRNKIGIPLYNIGMGAAKNIRIEWGFYRENLEEKIKNKNFQIANFESIPWINPDMSMVETIDYIKPSQTGNQNETEKIYIPTQFQRYSIKNMMLKTEMDNNTQDMSDLRLDIYYEDLANKIHYKKYIIKFNDGLGHIYDFNSNYSGIISMEIEYQVHIITK